MKRSPGPKRTTPLTAKSRPKPRATPIKPKKRTRNEFARIYGSRERVERIKALPCHVCGSRPSENAHTENGGMGRKADWQTIVNLCPKHHRELHGRGYIQYGTERFGMDELREWASHLATEIPA